MIILFVHFLSYVPISRKRVNYLYRLKCEFLRCVEPAVYRAAHKIISSHLQLQTMNNGRDITFLQKILQIAIEVSDFF